MILTPEIEQKAYFWAHSQVFSSSTRKEIQDLLNDEQSSLEVLDRFYRDLEFGTGGLRGVVGAGTNRMNIYNIRRASHALAVHLKTEYPTKDHKVAIAYDSRKTSREFAMETALVFASHGIKSLITERMRATPVLSFMVRHFNCSAGVCITASHNPPEYNGYKAYNETGGQVVHPQDKKILEIYEKTTYENLANRPLGEKNLIEEVGESVDEAYFHTIKESINFFPLPQDVSFPILYSPLGGVGAETLPKSLELFGFKEVSLVTKDCIFDGSFQGIISSNPEEPKAYQNALEQAQSSPKIRLILATDPDSDRFGMMLRENSQKDDWTWFTGHQLATLLTYFVLLSRQHHGTLPQNALVVKTVVTTELMKKVANSFGVLCEETLTGFKWICDLVERSKDKEFICGGEESYGFLAGHHARDKDAMVSACLAAQMIAYFEIKEQKNLTQVLFDLYERFGYYEEELRNFVFKGPLGMNRMNEIIMKAKTNPFFSFEDDSVQSFIDYEEQSIKTFDQQSNQWIFEQKTNLPSSLGIQYQLQSGGRISIRPSGTEPKLKVYVNLTDEIQNKEKVSKKVHDIFEKLIQHFELHS